MKITYSTSNKPKIVLILTPRTLLNEQIVENKYTTYITKYNYIIKNLTKKSINIKKKLLIKIKNNNNNYILTACYQSYSNLSKLILKLNLTIDLIIFDESHFISSWIDEIKYKFFIDNNILIKNKLFVTATPTEEMILQDNIFGKLVEKVKIYELINEHILCDIETIVKKMENGKKEYHNLAKLIVNCMIEYNKKKGIIYVNDCTSAENLYKLLKQYTEINTYIFVSKEFDDIDENSTNIKSFELNKNKSVIISVGKIGYGYDNEWIDFICFGDARQSDIDIRQIVGRGLRWNKENYPNKILHILVPIYKDEFDNYSKNDHLKKYLEYIIGECGNDKITKNIYEIKNTNNNNNKLIGKNYDGDEIPIEILRELCTTGNNKFTSFMIFLKSNNIIDELGYNELYEKNNDWMPIIGIIHEKYPKFCFQNIHPLKDLYYETINEAIHNYNITLINLKNKIGNDSFSDLTDEEIIKKINLINIKITLVDFNLYYQKIKD